jgi:hypothetical protein
MNTVSDNEVQMLQDARPLQVHRKTVCPPMADQLAGVFSELVQLRATNNQQIRKAGRVKKHLDVVILDLWVAANYSDNPWRRTRPQKGKRRNTSRHY